MMMSAATALAADWVQIYLDDNDNLIYFDPDRVTVTSQTGDNVEFAAQFRMVYSDKGRNALIDWYREYSIMPRGIENLSYDVATIQFKRDGENRYYRIIERVSYTANGTNLSDMHYVNPNGAWEKISVGSVVDVEYYEALLIVEGKLYKRIDSENL